MIHIQSFVFSPFSENTYVLYDDSAACIILDPGCLQQQERDELTGFVAAKGLKVERIVATHCHLDHVFGAKYLKEYYGVPFAIPTGEQQMLRMAPESAQRWGIPGMEPTQADELLPETGELSFGESHLQILFVPGHAPGHLAFYSPEQGFVMSGDVLFRGSIGRTDLPGGSMPQLEDSIRRVMYALPDHTAVYSGHGPATTIGEEKRANMFVRA